MKGNFKYENAGTWDNRHFKWYSFVSRFQLLEDSGFEVLFKTVTGQLPGASLVSKLLNEETSLTLYSQLKKLSPGLFGYQLLYVATPKYS